MSQVLEDRLARLACDFPISQNYFAWQAFGRGYGLEPDAPLPPYLERRNFEAIRVRANRIDVHQSSLTEFLARQPDRALDRFVLLDAQDWMPPQVLDGLWLQITRTARPDARVIFRTAAPQSVLPGRVSETLLSRWQYQERLSHELGRRDRSAIYGGFHLYTLKAREA
jgi:S-adenosylmethionine-diacylglycerol 3-amino-3-carboxypropyl transferase